MTTEQSVEETNSNSFSNHVESVAIASTVSTPPVSSSTSDTVASLKDEINRLNGGLLVKCGLVWCWDMLASGSFIFMFLSAILVLESKCGGLILLSLSQLFYFTVCMNLIPHFEKFQILIFTNFFSI